jgi:hypothetical protein
MTSAWDTGLSAATCASLVYRVLILDDLPPRISDLRVQDSVAFSAIAVRSLSDFVDKERRQPFGHLHRRTRVADVNAMRNTLSG